MEQISYIPGNFLIHPGPLGRYIPMIPAGVVTSWLRDHSDSGAWVLDPFGASARLVVEAARAGYRVLVACNNPIDRFLIELAANPPGEAELRASLADFGSTMKGDQRIEPFLRNLYVTSCSKCQQEVSADAFIWERGANSPFIKSYQCPNCGESGEFPISQVDEQKLAQLPGANLYRSRALERVTSIDDPDRALVEEALDVYLQRALYALFTMINKFESLPPTRRRPISALLLATFDQANTLWHHPSQRTRPRQLSTPPQFRENNVWKAMEDAIKAWTEAYPVEQNRIPLVHWPQQPPETGGICLFEGRLKDLLEKWPKDHSDTVHPSTPAIHSVVFAVPRPNQAYWTLSVLWSGWLWGRESAAPYKLVLHRRRYDWNWHCNALSSAFRSMKEILQPGANIFSITGETEPGFISAVLLAAALAGFDLKGVSLNQADEQAQIHLLLLSKGTIRKNEHPDLTISDHFIPLARQAAREYLKQLGEPAEYIQIHTAALSEIVADGFLQNQGTQRTGKEETLPAEILSLQQSAFQQAFTYRFGFVRFHGSPSSLETGKWWLRETNDPGVDGGEIKISTKSDWIVSSDDLNSPLSDRVEIAMVKLLVNKRRISYNEIEKMILESFPGLFTPDDELLQVCLESYAEADTSDKSFWHMRPQEAPAQRRSDLQMIASMIESLGTRLGYQSSQIPSPVQQINWAEKDGRVVYTFFPVASAVIGKLITNLDNLPKSHVLVFPGSRTGLISYKLRHDPRLQSFSTQGWRFVKYRHIRRLADNERLTQSNLEEQLDLDPMGKVDPQIAFI